MLTKPPFTTELVVACYQKPQYLRLILQSLLQQKICPQSVCFADDGSTKEVSEVIAGFQMKHDHFSIRHVWHADSGFRKNKILNKATRSSRSSYMIFIDDDCIMHPCFIARHVRLAARRQFLTGSLIRLDEQFTLRTLEEGIVAWNDDMTLRGWKAKNYSEYLKSMPVSAGMMNVLDRISPVRKSWAGCNSSAFLEDIIEVNGFDESMGYGGGDKEFGVRLRNSGVKGRHLRYSAPLFHLHHGRSYANERMLRTNRRKIVEARKSKKTWSQSGIKKLSLSDDQS